MPNHFEIPVPDEQYPTIVLHNIEGIARKSGTDDDGNKWIEFEVDAFAGQLSGECSICAKPLWGGWLCLDGGDEVCDEHIIYADDEEEPEPNGDGALGLVNAIHHSQGLDPLDDNEEKEG